MPYLNLTAEATGRVIAAHGQDTTPAQRVSAILCFLSIVCFATISANLLVSMGIPYDIPGGSFIVKLHPGTYLLFAAFVVSLFSSRNPLIMLSRLASAMPMVFIYALIIFFVALYLIIRNGTSGAAYIIDTWLTPALMAWVLLFLPGHLVRFIFTSLIILVMINAIIGVAESLVQQRLIPHVAGDVVLTESVFRATALYGHPLSNAKLTAAALLLVMVLPIRTAQKAGIGSVMVLGLLAFGSRTALGVVIVLAAVYVSTQFVHVIYGRGITKSEALEVIIVLMVALCGAFITYYHTDLGDRIFKFMYWDASADVRIQILQVFDYLTPEELYFGVSPERFSELSYNIGYYYPYSTIENFWIIIIINMGLFVFIYFFITVFGFCVSIIRRYPLSIYEFSGFFIIASSSNSLADKTASFALVVALTLGAAAFDAAAMAEDELSPPPAPSRAPTSS